jgi:hypothetical protein
MLAGGSKPGSDQQRAELIAVQPGGVGFVIEWSRSFFFDGISAEPGDRARTASPRSHRKWLRSHRIWSARSARSASLDAPAKAALLAAEPSSALDIVGEARRWGAA